MRWTVTKQLGLLALALTALGPLPAFSTEDYPQKPVKIITGYQAGSVNDIAARLLADGLRAALGQPVLVENRPGATGTLADQAIATAAPDGYSLLVASSAITTNAALKANYSAFEQLHPITTLGISLNTFVAAPQAPFATMTELIGHAKANPGEVLYATSGIGSSSHLVAEALQVANGITLQHVPYPSAAERNLAVVAGEVDLAIGTPFLGNDDIKQLGVLGQSRSALLPEVPTLQEQGLDLQIGISGSWIGLFAPQGTPPEIIEILHAATLKTLAAPEARDRLQAFGFEVKTSDTTSFAADFNHQIADWSKIASSLGLRQ